MDKYIIVDRVSTKPYKRRVGTSDHQKHNPINREGVTCKHNCGKYPCFNGICTLETNFARTCKDYEPKQLNMELEGRR